jgi:hypothetical protein
MENTEKREANWKQADIQGFSAVCLWLFHFCYLRTAGLPPSVNLPSFSIVTPVYHINTDKHSPTGLSQVANTSQGSTH